VELAGLEPATSWVRSRMALRASARTFGAGKRNPVDWVAERPKADGRGCMRMSFDSGTGTPLVPIGRAALWRGTCGGSGGDLELVRREGRVTHG
jgi:hypothetical protein